MPDNNISDDIIKVKIVADMDFGDAQKQLKAASENIRGMKEEMADMPNISRIFNSSLEKTASIVDSVVGKVETLSQGRFEGDDEKKARFIQGGNEAIKDANVMRGLQVGSSAYGIQIAREWFKNLPQAVQHEFDAITPRITAILRSRMSSLTRDGIHFEGQNITALTTEMFKDAGIMKIVGQSAKHANDEQIKKYFSYLIPNAVSHNRLNQWHESRYGSVMSSIGDAMVQGKPETLFPASYVPSFAKAHAYIKSVFANEEGKKVLTKERFNELEQVFAKNPIAVRAAIASGISHRNDRGVLETRRDLTREDWENMREALYSELENRATGAGNNRIDFYGQSAKNQRDLARRLTSSSAGMAMLAMHATEAMSSPDAWTEKTNETGYVAQLHEARRVLDRYATLKYSPFVSSGTQNTNPYSRDNAQFIMIPESQNTKLISGNNWKNNQDISDTIALISLAGYDPNNKDQFNIVRDIYENGKTINGVQMVAAGTHGNGNDTVIRMISKEARDRVEQQEREWARQNGFSGSYFQNFTDVQRAEMAAYDERHPEAAKPLLSVKTLGKQYDAENKSWSPSADMGLNLAGKRFAVVDLEGEGDGSAWVSRAVMPYANQSRFAVAGKGSVFTYGDENNRAFAERTGFLDSQGRWMAKGLNGEMYDISEYDGIIPADVIKNLSAYGHVDPSTGEFVYGKRRTTARGGEIFDNSNEAISEMVTAAIQRYGFRAIANYENESNNSNRLGAQMTSFMRLSPEMRAHQAEMYAQRMRELDTEEGQLRYVFTNPEEDWVAAQVHKNHQLLASPTARARVDAYRNSLQQSAITGQYIDFGQDDTKISDMRLSDNPLRALLEKTTDESTRNQVLSKMKTAMSDAYDERVRTLIDLDNSNDTYAEKLKRAEATVSKERKRDYTDRELIDLLNLTKDANGEDRVIDFAHMNEDHVGVLRSPTGYGNMVYARNVASEIKPIFDKFQMDQSGIYVSKDSLDTLQSADYDGDRAKIVTRNLADAVKRTREMVDEEIKQIEHADTSIKTQDVKYDAKLTDDATQRAIAAGRNVQEVSLMGGSSGGIRGMQVDRSNPTNKQYLIAQQKMQKMYDVNSVWHKNPQEVILEGEREYWDTLKLGREFTKFTDKANTVFQYDADQLNQDEKVNPNAKDIFKTSTGQYINMRNLKALQLDQTNLPSINMDSHLMGVGQARGVYLAGGSDPTTWNAISEAIEHLGFAEGIGEKTKALMSRYRQMFPQFGSGERASISKKETEELQAMTAEAKSEIAEQTKAAYKKGFGVYIDPQTGKEYKSKRDYIDAQYKKYGIDMVENATEKFGFTEQRIESRFGKDTAEALSNDPTIAAMNNAVAESVQRQADETAKDVAESITKEAETSTGKSSAKNAKTGTKKRTTRKKAEQTPVIDEQPEQEVVCSVCGTSYPASLGECPNAANHPTKQTAKQAKKDKAQLDRVNEIVADPLKSFEENFGKVLTSFAGVETTKSLSEKMLEDFDNTIKGHRRIANQDKEQTAAEKFFNIETWRRDKAHKDFNWADEHFDKTLWHEGSAMRDAAQEKLDMIDAGYIGSTRQWAQSNADNLVEGLRKSVHGVGDEFEKQQTQIEAYGQAIKELESILENFNASRRKLAKEAEENGDVVPDSVKAKDDEARARIKDRIKEAENLRNQGIENIQTRNSQSFQDTADILRNQMYGKTSSPLGRVDRQVSNYKESIAKELAKLESAHIVDPKTGISAITDKDYKDRKSELIALQEYAENGFRNDLFNRIFDQQVNQNNRMILQSNRMARQHRSRTSMRGIGRFLIQNENEYQQREILQNNMQTRLDELKAYRDGRIDEKTGERIGGKEKDSEEYKKATREIDRLSDAMKKNQSAMKGLKGPAGVLDATMSSLSMSFQRLAMRLGRQLFYKALAEAKKFVKEFDKSMTTIQMITLKTDSQMSKLGDGLIAQAKNLKVSISEVTKAAEALYRQGLSDKEVEERLDVITKFSVVSGAKIDAATKLVTVAMNTGLVTDPRIATDIVTALGDNAATNAVEIEKGIEKAGAAAAADGTSFAELAAMLTAITSTTQIGGNVAGRTLNTIFGRMNKIGTNELVVDENGNMISGSDIAKLLQSQGIKLYDDQGNKRSSFDVLNDLSKKWDSMSDAEQQQIAAAIAGTRQYSNFAAIMQGMSEGKVDEYMKLAGESEGIVEDKYDTYAKSLEASFADLKNTFDSIIHDLIDSGALKDIVGFLKDVITGIGGIIKAGGGLPALIAMFGALAVASAAIKGGIAGAAIMIGTLAAVGIAAAVGGGIRASEVNPKEEYQNYIDKTSSINKKQDAKLDRLSELGHKENRTKEEDRELVSLARSVGSYAGTTEDVDKLTSSIRNLGNVASSASSDVSEYTDNIVKEARNRNNQERLAQFKTSLSPRYGSGAAVQGMLEDYEAWRDEMNGGDPALLSAFNEFKGNRDVANYIDYDSYDPVNAILIAKDKGKTIDENVRKKYLNAVVDYAYGAIANGYYTDPSLEQKYSNLSETDAKSQLYRVLANGQSDSQEFQAITGLLPTDFSNATSRDVLADYNNDKIKEIFKANVVSILEQNKNNLPISPDAIDAWAEWFTNDYFQINDDFGTPYKLPSVQDFSNALYNAWGFDKPYEDVVKTAQDRAVEGGYQLTTNDLLARSNLDEVGETGYFVDRKTGQILSPEEAIALTNEYNTRIEELKSDKYKQKGYYYIDKNGRKVFRSPTGEFFTSEGDARKTYFTLHPSEARFGSLETGTMSLDSLLASEIEATRPDLIGYKDYVLGSSSNGYISWQQDKSNNNKILADKMLREIYSFRSSEGYSQARGNTDLEKWFWHANTNNLAEWDYLVRNNPELGRILAQVKRDQYGNILNSAEDQDRIFREAQDYLLKSGKDYGARTIQTQEKGQLAMQAYEGLTSGSWFASQEARNQAIQDEYDTYYRNTLKTIPEDVLRNARQMGYENTLVPSIDQYAADKGLIYATDEAKAYLSEIVGPDLARKIVSRQKLSDSEQLYVNRKLDNAQYGLTELTARNRLSGIKEVRDAIRNGQTIGFNEGQYSATAASQYLTGWGDYNEYVALISKRQMRPDEFTEADAKRLEELNLSLENFQKNAEITVEIEGVKQLEETGKIVAGVSSELEKLRKGGKIAIDVLLQYRTEAFAAGQQSAKLYGGTAEEQDEAAMAILGMNREQYYTNRTENLARARKTEQQERVINARTWQERYEGAKTESQRAEILEDARAAGYDYFGYTLPSGYSVDEFGIVYGENNRPNYEETRKRRASGFKYVGGVDIGNVGSLAGQSKNYSELEKANALSNILSGGMVRTVGENGNASLFDEAVGYAGERTRELLRQWQNSETNLNFKEWLDQNNIPEEDRALVLAETELAKKSATEADALERARLNSTSLGGMFNYRQVQYGQSNKGALAANRLIGVLGSANVASFADLNELVNDNRREDWKDLIESSDELSKKLREMGVAIDANGNIDFSAVKENGYSAAEVLNVLKEAASGASDSLKGFSEVLSTGDIADRAERYFRGEFITQEGKEAFANYIGNENIANIVGNNANEYKARSDEWREYDELTSEGKALWRSKMGYAPSDPGEYNPFAGLEGENLEYANKLYENARYGQQGLSELDRLRGFQSAIAAAREGTLADFRAQDSVGYYKDYVGAVSGGEEYLQDIERLHNAGIDFADVKAGKVAYEELEKALGTEEAQRFLQTQKDIDAELEGSFIKASKKAGEYTDAFADSTMKLSKRGVTARKELARLTEEAKDYQDAITVADRYRGKTGKAIAADEVAVKQFGRLGFKKEDIESWGKEEAERYSSLLEDTVNEEFAQQNLAPVLNEALSRAYELNPTVTIDTFVDANGNLDLSALASFLDGVAPEVASMLRMYDGIIAESAIKLETTTGKDGLPVIQVVQESLGGTRLKSGYGSGGGGYNHKGSGGGGGKSAVDKLLEDLKRKISEIEHQSKLLEIDEKYYDFVNDYGGYTVNIDDQIANQERLRAAYAANISEMNAMLAKTAQGSDDWYKLKDAIMSAEEAMESIKNTINDLNQKRIGILEQKQTNEDKPDTHASTMLQKMATRYQKNGRFENYEAIMNQNIDVMRQEVNQNNKQIKEWEDLLRTYREGSDSWIETRDKIWALKEENAELENQMASDIIDLQEARIAQIAKDLENAQSPLEHANSMLETYGSMFESTGNQAGLRNTLQSTIDNNTQLKALNDEAIEELKKQINAMKESDPARESAISTLYQLEEASAQYEASILSNRQAIEESYINEITQGHADSGAILEHEMKLLSEAEKKFLHDNDFVNYENIVKEEARNTADRLEEQRNALADYLELQESGRITEGSQQWRTLEETIRSTKENIASLSNEYDDWITKLQTTRFENLQRSFTESDDLAQHNLRMIQYEETRYQNNGQLANYGILLAQDNEMQKDRAASISRYLNDLREQLEAAEDNPDLYKRIRSEITKYEEQLSQTNNTIEKNTDLLHKNEEAIRKVRQAVENTIDKEIRARIQKQRDMLAATVSIENTILDVIRKNYQEQWKLQKTDIDKKKQALSEEKNLINERLNARKKAMSEETKYEELAEYQRQLALIAADPTRTKEANELRRKIKDLSKDISMDIATDQANAQAEAIDDQIKAMDNYVATYEEDLNEMLSDANNFREDLDEIMGGSFDEFVAWMQEHNEGYNLATAETRRQMEQGWEDTWKKMKGELDTYWQEVDESMRTREGFLEYMQNSDTYKSASESGQQSLLAYWGDMYDDYTASLIKDANFDHTHDILNKIDELQDWEFKVRPIGIEDYLINMGYSDYVYNRDKSVEPYNPYDNYEGVGYVTPPPAPSAGGGGNSSNSGGGSGSGGGSSAPKTAGQEYIVYGTRYDGLHQKYGPTYKSISEAESAVERGLKGGWSDLYIVDSSGKVVARFSADNFLDNALSGVTNSSLSAFEKLKAKGILPYAEGGLVDYTGPAWVDGTKARPEAFLDATDTKLLRDMLDSFSYVSQKPFISQIDQKGITGQSVNVGDVNVNLYEAKLESDADYDLIAKKVGSAFTKEIQKTGLNLSAYAF